MAPADDRFAELRTVVSRRIYRECTARGNAVGVGNRIFTTVFDIRVSYIAIDFQRRFVALHRIAAVRVLLGILETAFEIRNGDRSVRIVISRNAHVGIMICSAERAIGRHRHSGAPTAGTGSETVLSGDGLHQRPSGGIRLRIRFLGVCVLACIFAVRFLTLGGHALDVGVFEGIPVGLDVLHQIVGGFVAGGRASF